MSEYPVSITLQNNDDARAIIEAITADNPDVTIAHYPAMVKLDGPGKIRINAETVSEKLGREWDPQEIHLSVITLSGNIEEDDDFFQLAWS
jgi:phenol/toluene 2-monooxygenase (NADH) P2/A2